jgi:flagellar hook-associated protein 2
VSDISIPGVTASKYKTDELIAGLMKVERVPRDRADADLKLYQKQQSAWRDLNQQTSTLRDSAKSLYSYNNPFSEKNATSTNDRAITATATREARDQSFKVSVSQIASADAFLSKEVPEKGTVPKGEYVFSVGEKTITVNWKGGSYRDFFDALNRRSEGVLRGSLIQVTPNTRSMLIESLKTGAKERLTFSKDALPFALDNGFIKKNDATAVSVTPNAIQAPPVSNSVAEFSSTARAASGYTLEYTLSVSGPTEAAQATPPPPPGPDTGAPGSITYQNITVTNSASETALGETTPPAPKEPVTDLAVLSLKSTKGIAIPLPDIPSEASKMTVTVPLGEYGDVNALLVHNRNTDRSVTLENVRIIDPRAAGDYAPVNPVSVAQDATLKYEGIPITRSTNAIDDLVPGVTINLHEPTDKQETLTVKPDSDAAKEAIIALVGNYNRVMANINILTQDKPEIITEISYFTPDEKKAAEDKLGMMLGDMTLNGVKSSLQRIMSNVYPGTGSRKITMLAQLGISTKSGSGSGVDATRLRGYLEIDEKKLDEALKSNMEDIKALFGSDTNGDLVVDSGVAQSLDANLTPYVQTGGIFPMRTQGLDSRITDTQKKITLLDQQLARKEADLKAKYGQMEGTLNNLQNQSSAISNFSKQNGN